MRIRNIIPLVLLIVLQGCFSEQSVVNKYYTIEHTGEVSVGDTEKPPMINGFCEIVPVEINAMYERNQIVNRSESHVITYYKYHQWAVRPSLAVREMVYQQLETSGLFEGISTRYMSKIPNYKFATILHKLEVIEEGDVFSAHLDIEYRLLNSSGILLLKHAAVRTEPLAGKDLNLFAGEISSIIHEELETFISRIGEASFLPDPRESMEIRDQ